MQGFFEYFVIYGKKYLKISKKRGVYPLHCRTDMAFESHQRLTEGGKECSGVTADSYSEEGMTVREVRVSTPEAARKIGKPQGSYLTLELFEHWQTDNDGILKAAALLSRHLRPLLPQKGTVLVAGLGNLRITPDSIGPLTVDRVIVTRHLTGNMPELFGSMRPVCAIKAGVLGTTGVETAELIRGVCSRVRPAAVIAVDALASLSTERLCRSFQLSDTGIVPGSGACNPRRALNAGTLGVPVIALGVPTVVDADTIIGEATGQTPDYDSHGSFLVTPKDIDALAEKSAKVLGYAINLALQGDMSIADMEQFLC